MYFLNVTKPKVKLRLVRLFAKLAACTPDRFAATPSRRLRVQERSRFTGVRRGARPACQSLSETKHRTVSYRPPRDAGSGSFPPERPKGNGRSTKSIVEQSFRAARDRGRPLFPHCVLATGSPDARASGRARDTLAGRKEEISPPLCAADPFSFRSPVSITATSGRAAAVFLPRSCMEADFRGGSHAFGRRTCCFFA